MKTLTFADEDSDLCSCSAGFCTVSAVVLKTKNSNPWTNEFDSKQRSPHDPLTPPTCRIDFLFVSAGIELSCVIESISTTNPRIEWKKITSEGPSYVYFNKRISGNRGPMRP